VRRFAAALVLAAGLALASTAQAETVSVTCDTPPAQRDGCNRWYSTASVLLDWSWEPAAMSATGCTGADLRAEDRYELTCTVTWSTTTISKKVWIGIDRTAPQLLGIKPDRPPDHNGWFNHPVGLSFEAVDATSGVASCSTTSYGGPDGAGIPIGGSCQDIAGNVGQGSFPLYYDATRPAAPKLTARPRSRRISLRWSSTPDTIAQVVRVGPTGRSKLVFLGAGSKFTDRKLRNGRRYRYVVTLIDQAGNRAANRIRAVPTTSPLLSPGRGAQLRDAPLLVWKPVRRASYYNVQLVHNGSKILSRWPQASKLQLGRSWRFGGRRYRLLDGRYCWYVWPGFGDVSKRRYGELLGKSCFRIER
jgi:hypothetical protein